MRYVFYLIIALLSLVGGWYAMQWFDSSDAGEWRGIFSFEDGQEAGDDSTPKGARWTDERGSRNARDDNGDARDDNGRDTDDLSLHIPTFDVVRVTPDGAAVIAGRAAPGAVITVYDGDTIIATTDADGRGEWVVLPEKPLAGGTRRLSIQARQADGRIFFSDRDVSVTIPLRRGKAVPKQALIVADDRQSGLRLLQVPDQDKLTGLSLQSVEYPESGIVRYSGTAPAGSTLRIYRDNRILATVEADGNGMWALETDDPSSARMPEETPRAGHTRHVLRIDRLNADGTVRERVETAFSRTPTREVTIDPGTEYIIVGDGHSLWRIARRYYGQGIAYKKLYQSNRDLIRNPDLIYPGQIFAAPPDGDGNAAGMSE